MIKVNRGAEPEELRDVRNAQLAILRGLGRAPEGKDIVGYRVVAKALWKAQFAKCCYCEHRISMSFNDVEHYRPKASANRSPGCVKKGGYWWLAFEWDNLLYACPSCNRSEKNDLFPLAIGSISLNDGESAPGSEIPLLLNAGAAGNPVEHIQYVEKSLNERSSPVWWAEPRNNSQFGNTTIRVCGLNRHELLELRNLHVETNVRPTVNMMRKALDDGNMPLALEYYTRALAMFKPSNAYAALNYDVYCKNFSDLELAQKIHRTWLPPSQVGL